MRDKPVSRPLRMKFEHPEYKRKLYYKIKNIKALDRAIFNIHLKMNSMFDRDYECVNTNEENKEEDIEQLQKLNDLKSKWEKELMYMYFEEEDDN